MKNSKTQVHQKVQDVSQTGVFSLALPSVKKTQRRYEVAQAIDDADWAFS